MIFWLHIACVFETPWKWLMDMTELCVRIFTVCWIRQLLYWLSFFDVSLNFLLLVYVCLFFMFSLSSLFAQAYKFLTKVWNRRKTSVANTEETKQTKKNYQISYWRNKFVCEFYKQLKRNAKDLKKKSKNGKINYLLQMDGSLQLVFLFPT